MPGRAANVLSISEKQRQASNCWARDQHVSQRRNDTETQRCEKKRLRRKHNSSSSKGGLTSGCPSLCLSATIWWRSSAWSSLNKQNKANNGAGVLIKQPRDFICIQQDPDDGQTRTHVHHSWARHPPHWPWPLNYRVLFHLLQNYSCWRVRLARAWLICICWCSFPTLWAQTSTWRYS